MKNENGVTLIVLIITVIVMLIIAGVVMYSINTLGLFSQVKDVADLYNNAQKNEADAINDLNNLLGSYLIASGTQELPGGQTLQDYVDGRIATVVGEMLKPTYVSGTLNARNSIVAGTNTQITINQSSLIGNTSLVSGDEIIIPQDGLYSISLGRGSVSTVTNRNMLSIVCNGSEIACGEGSIGGSGTYVVSGSSVCQKFTSGDKISFRIITSAATNLNAGIVFTIVYLGSD